jgi:hypothetical protein
MTYAPDDLIAALTYLHQQGAPWDSLGCVAGPGDRAGGGYHCGWDWLAPVYGTDDYSYCESARDHVKSDAASAIDIGGATWWHDLSLWLVDRCEAGATGVEDIREVIYTPDFVSVHRWDRLGIRTTGDSSHLFHTHISFFRASEGHRGTFLALLRRYFEHTPTSPAQTSEDDDMATTGTVPAGWAFGDGPRRDQCITGAGLGPVGGGEFGWKRVVLGLGADFTPKAGVQVRVAVKSEGLAWGVQNVTLRAPDNRVAIFLPNGVTKISIGRAKRAAGDVDTLADGSTLSAETCPVWWDLEPEKR